MTDEQDDIRRYLDGKMSGSERNDFEKRVLSDPFLADALEGTETVGAREFSKDLNELSHKIKQKNRTGLFTPLRIAAGIILISAVSSLIYYYSSTESSLLAVNKNKEAGSGSDSAATDARDSSAELLSLAKVEKSSGVEKITSVAGQPKKQAKANEGPTAVLPTVGVNPDLATADKLPTELAIVEEEKVDALVGEERKLQEELATEKKPEVRQREAAESASKKDAISRAAVAPSKAASYKTVTGNITEAEDNSPLPGVVIKANDINTTTTSDRQGNYSITIPETARLTYSVVGRESQEIDPGNRSRIDVKLKDDPSQLSEIMIMGQGASGASNNFAAPSGKMAAPMAGINAYNNYLESNMRYPDEARQRNINGRVTIEFTVTAEGRLTDFKIVQALGYGCDEEVIRLVKEGPAWTPSLRNNTPTESVVRVRLKF